MELHTLTRPQLYSLATAAHIRRRSTMNKAQLTAAIKALAETDPQMYGALELHHSLNTTPDQAETPAAEAPSTCPVKWATGELCQNCRDRAEDTAAEAAAAADPREIVPDTEGAEYWTEQARQCHQRRYESEQRSDTDGFLSQWAATQMANRYHHLATLAKRGWTWDYHAIFDLEGNLVAAKYLQTKYGWSWALLASDDPDSRIIGWFNESNAQDPARARANNAKKGYYVGLVRVSVPEPRRGSIPADRAGDRADGGFSRDVVILDNGLCQRA